MWYDYRFVSIFVKLVMSITDWKQLQNLDTTEKGWKEKEALKQHELLRNHSYFTLEKKSHLTGAPTEQWIFILIRADEGNIVSP